MSDGRIDASSISESLSAYLEGEEMAEREAKYLNARIVLTLGRGTSDTPEVARLRSAYRAGPLSVVRRPDEVPDVFNEPTGMFVMRRDWDPEDEARYRVPQHWAPPQREDIGDEVPGEEEADESGVPQDGEDGVGPE